MSAPERSDTPPLRRRLADRARAVVARAWPVVRLRWVLFGTLLLVAALPGVAAFGLRVYENALVRRTEAELTAQAAALAASAALLWPGPTNGATDDATTLASAESEPVESYQDVSTRIDLRTSAVLPERPAPTVAAGAPDPVALAVARRIAPAIAATKRETLASILLLDARGTLLNGRDAGRSLDRVPEVGLALRGETRTVLRHNDFYTGRFPLEWISRATDIRLHQARPILVGQRVVGAILVSRSPRALFRGMWEDAGKIAAGALAILIALIALTAVLARAIVRPIENLSRATRELAQGRATTLPRPTLRVHEIDGLIGDFHAMAASIDRRSRYLRDFAAALSHEFKTPLAGIRGGLELLDDHAATMSATERARFIGNMTVDADRLTRLVSRLMELAQADMRPANIGASADPGAVIAQVADAMRGDSFAITVDLPAFLPALAIDAAALETVLATLVENARQAGAGQLVISGKRDGERIAIVLNDDGPGIPGADRERIFDPFFTSRRVDGGTGLGLPIARALAENSRGWLELRPAPRGASFALVLPVAGPTAG